jgi:hypothetical protein
VTTFTFTTPFPKATINRAYLKGITAGNYIQIQSLSLNEVIATEPGFPRLYVLAIPSWVFGQSSKMLRMEQIFDPINSHAYNAGIEISYDVPFKLIVDTDAHYRLHLWSGAPADPSNRRDLQPLPNYWLPI